MFLEQVQDVSGLCGGELDAEEKAANTALARLHIYKEIAKLFLDGFKYLA